MDELKTIRGAQSLASNNVQAECIKACKAYDWTVLPGNGGQEVTIASGVGSACVAAIDTALANGSEVTVQCTVSQPPGPQFGRCGLVDDACGCNAFCHATVVKQGIPVQGSDQAAVVKLVQSIPIQLTILIDGERPIDPSTGDFACPIINATVTDSESTVLCLPAPLTSENISCRVLDIQCNTSCLIKNGDAFIVSVDVSLCIDVRVEAEVTLELAANFCQPRLPITPPANTCNIEVPFPPQCDFFAQLQLTNTLFDPGVIDCSGLLMGFVASEGVGVPNAMVTLTSSDPRVTFVDTGTTTTMTVTDANGNYFVQVVIEPGTPVGTLVTFTSVATALGQTVISNIVVATVSCPCTCDNIVVTLNVPGTIECSAMISGTVSCDGEIPLETPVVMLTSNPMEGVTISPPEVDPVTGTFTAEVTIAENTAGSIEITATATVCGAMGENTQPTEVSCPCTCDNIVVTLNVPGTIECSAMIDGSVRCDDEIPLETPVVMLTSNPMEGVTISSPEVNPVTGTFTAEVTIAENTAGSIEITATATVCGAMGEDTQPTEVSCPGCLVNPGPFFGTNLNLSDDGFLEQALGFPFTFYGMVFDSVFVNSNGNVTFNSGSSDFTPTFPEFFNGPPRVAPYWIDLDPNCNPPANNVYVQTSPGQFIVTWLNLAYFPCNNNLPINTLQLVLCSSGTISFSYLSLDNDLPQGPVIQSFPLVGVAMGGGGPSRVFQYNATTNMNPNNTVVGPVGPLNTLNMQLIWTPVGDTDYALSYAPCSTAPC